MLQLGHVLSDMVRVLRIYKFHLLLMLQLGHVLSDMVRRWLLHRI